MVYPTKDAGLAIGEIISSLSETTPVEGLEIRLTADALVAEIKIGKVARAVKKDQVKANDTVKAKSKAGGKKRDEAPILGRNKLFECNGKSLSVKDWSKELGLSYATVYGRIRTTGNPLGLTKPTDADVVVIAGAQTASGAN